VTTLTRYAVQLRAQLSGDTLVGHAAVFGQVAKVPGGWEEFDPGAFDEVLDSSGSDSVSLWNHDMSMLLGRRSAGTLRVKVDGDGLPFEVDLPDTSYAADLRVLVARGDVTGASIGFLPAAGGTVTRRAPDGATLTRITKVGYLRDLGPVTMPAYGGTDVALRHYDFGRPNRRSQLIRARHRATLGRV
jgi:hypothetical protein